MEQVNSYNLGARTGLIKLQVSVIKDWRFFVEKIVNIGPDLLFDTYASFWYITKHIYV